MKRALIELKREEMVERISQRIERVTDKWCSSCGWDEECRKAADYQWTVRMYIDACLAAQFEKGYNFGMKKGKKEGMSIATGQEKAL